MPSSSIETGLSPKGDTKMIEETPIFNLGDEVQTNEYYSEMAKAHNCLPLGSIRALSIKGKVTEVRQMDIHKTTYNKNGFVRLHLEIERKITAIRVDGGELFNQNYFEKVE